MIGKLQNSITIQQLYDYAVQHNYLNTEVSIVLDIISRESIKGESIRLVNNKSLISPASNIDTIDFSGKVEYTIEDVLTLFST